MSAVDGGVEARVVAMGREAMVLARATRILGDQSV